MKYVFIDEMDGKGYWWFSVALACELLGVSRSGFYDWRKRRSAPPTAREREQRLLLAAIVVAHIASGRRYGSPRIHADLVDQGWRVGVNRIARVMAEAGIEQPFGTPAASSSHPPGQGRPRHPRSARTRLHRRDARHPLGHRHQLRAHHRRVAVSRGDHRPVLQSGGRLGRPGSHAHRPGARGADHGAHGQRPRPRTDRALRPRIAIVPTSAQLVSDFPWPPGSMPDPDLAARCSSAPRSGLATHRGRRVTDNGSGGSVSALGASPGPRALTSSGSGDAVTRFPPL